jgi:hypothetical protein
VESFFDRLFKPKLLRTEFHTELGEVLAYDNGWVAKTELPPFGTVEIQGGSPGRDNSPSTKEKALWEEIRPALPNLIDQCLTALKESVELVDPAIQRSDLRLSTIQVTDEPGRFTLNFEAASEISEGPCEFFADFENFEIVQACWAD